MSGPCLCGDPYCGRCFPDPQAAECPKCGGPIHKSELPYREYSYEDKAWIEERRSENIVYMERDGKRVPCHVKCPDICETCGKEIPDGEMCELDECPACRSCFEKAEARAEHMYEVWKETHHEDGTPVEEEA